MTSLNVIDNGYWYSNLIIPKTLSKKIRIRSKVQFSEEPFLTNNTDFFQHDEIKAIVGEGAKQHSIELDKTRDEAYRILTYTLIAKTLHNQDFSKINLVINYPLNIFNKETKNNFEEFLKTPDFINIFLNKEQKTFHIQNCLVFPQTIPSLFLS